MTRHDVVIVGGGPAGMTAAALLAEAGRDVVIVDEAAGLGGQYYRGARAGYRPDGVALIERVHRAGARVLAGTTVWGAEAGGRVFAADVATGAPHTLEAPVTVLATGAFERTGPFPGWLLPGVVTPGFALHLATVDRVAVGARVVLAGSGPFLLPVAAALCDVGVRVEAMLEWHRPYRPSAVLGAARHPGMVAEAARYLARLARHGVRPRQGMRVLSAQGSEQVRAVTIGRVDGTGASETIEVDALCVGYGFRPSTELARLLGARMRLEDASGELLPVLDERGATSVPGVYVAGEAAGIAGVHAAKARGARAALAILGRPAGQGSRAEAFASRLARLYPPVPAGAGLADETVVCRCEGVTAGEIRAAAATGWNDLAGAKGASRAGMGLCQGRQCGHTVAALVQERTGRPAALNVRMPVKPVPVSALVHGVEP